MASGELTPHKTFSFSWECFVFSRKFSPKLITLVQLQAKVTIEDFEQRIELHDLSYILELTIGKG